MQAVQSQVVTLRVPADFEARQRAARLRARQARWAVRKALAARVLEKGALSLIFGLAAAYVIGKQILLTEIER